MHHYNNWYRYLVFIVVSESVGFSLVFKEPFGLVLSTVKSMWLKPTGVTSSLSKYFDTPKLGHTIKTNCVKL